MRFKFLILAAVCSTQLFTPVGAQSESQKDLETPHLKNSSSSQYFRGVSFRNANKVEFKYKERIKNFKEQLKMGIEKNWLTSQEAQEFKEKIDVLEKMEKKVSDKKYPKEEVDHMEKMFTLYNQQFHKASTTPMDKKQKEEKEKSSKIPKSGTEPSKNAASQSSEAKKAKTQPESKSQSKGKNTKKTK